MVGRGRGRGRGALEDQQTEMAEMRRMIEDLARSVQTLQGQERREAPDGDPNPSEDELEGNPEDEQDVHNPFHDVAGEGEHVTFDYEGSNSIFTFSVSNNSGKEKKDGVVDFSKPPIYDDCLCEVCCGNCGVEEDEDTNKDAIKDDCLCKVCCGNCGEEEDEDANKDAIKALKKDIDKKFVDFLGVNTFLMQLPKAIANLVNEINDGKGNFGTARLKLKRKFIGSGSSIYSKYLFIWKERIQLQANMSKEDLKQWKILSGFSTIKGSNLRKNSFQPRESDAGASRKS